MKRQIIRITEQDLNNIIKESVKNILSESKFEAAKYQNKWSIFDNDSRTFSNIGIGKKKATEKAKELNDYCKEKDNVKESKVNEVRGWTLEKDDVTWVNNEEEGASDKAWMVRIWPGSGYYLPAFAAFAQSEQEALEKVVAYLDKKGNNDFFFDESVERTIDELKEEGKSEEEIWDEIDETFCYVDATMDGAKQPHHVLWENLAIYPYDEKRFQ